MLVRAGKGSGLESEREVRYTRSAGARGYFRLALKTSRAEGGKNAVGDRQ